MVEKTKEELKRDKAARIIVMVDRSIEMLNDLKDDVIVWSGDIEIAPQISVEHQMHQNETCANLRFLVDYLENKQRGR